MKIFSLIKPSVAFTSRLVLTTLTGIGVHNNFRRRASGYLDREEEE